MNIYDMQTAIGRAMQDDLDAVSTEELQAAGDMHDKLVSGTFYDGKRMMPESESQVSA